jgi:hypothetical protein
MSVFATIATFGQYHAAVTLASRRIALPIRVQAAKISKIAKSIQSDARPISGVHRRGAKYGPTPTMTVPSWFPKVTVVPSLAVNAAGVNAKPMMPTFESSAEATNIWPKNNRQEVVFIGRSPTAVL